MRTLTKRNHSREENMPIEIGASSYNSRHPLYARPGRREIEITKPKRMTFGRVVPRGIWRRTTEE